MEKLVGGVAAAAACGVAVYVYHRLKGARPGNFDEIPFVDGYYIDPIHAPPSFKANIYDVADPWMGGVRYMARKSDTPDEIVIVGCDDNLHWWTLDGTFAHKDTGSVVIDFAHKAPHVGFLRCLWRRDSPTFASVRLRPLTALNNACTLLTSCVDSLVCMYRSRS